MSYSRKSSCVAFQAQLSPILEILAQTAVAEINKIVDDGTAVLRLEMSQNQREIETLKRKVQSLERELWTTRRTAESRVHPPPVSVPISDELRRTKRERVFQQELIFSLRRDGEPAGVEEVDTPLQSSILRNESANKEKVRTEPVLIKQEKLEEDLCYSDPHPTPVEEEQVIQPTPAGDVKKPDTEPTPVGDPEELSEQHSLNENEALKNKLQLLQHERRTAPGHKVESARARGSPVKTRSVGVQVFVEEQQREGVFGQECSFSLRRDGEPAGVEESANVEKVRTEPVLIKQEKLEEDLRYSDPQPTPVEEEPITQPTPVGDVKKPDTEPTPVGDPEELSEQHRCGHGDEVLSGLEFVGKAEQEEEHQDLRIKPRQKEEMSGPRENPINTRSVGVQVFVEEQYRERLRERHEYSFNLRRDGEPAGVEESANKEKVRTEPVLFKQEKLEEGVCYSDPQPTPVEEEQVTQPTPAGHRKKPDTEPTTVGDPEELSEQHRCGHSDEELSGLEFVGKAEQEEEHFTNKEKVRTEPVLIKQEKLEEGLCCRDPQPTPVGDPEELSEQHNCRHGDEELSGLEFVGKAEQEEEHSTKVRTEPVLIKQERLEEGLCYSDPQPTPVEEEQVTQPTLVGDVKKPDTEPTPVGDPEELSEQHRCGHGDEELSGLQFVGKAEQEEEHQDLRMEPRRKEEMSGPRENPINTRSVGVQVFVEEQCRERVFGQECSFNLRSDGEPAGVEESANVEKVRTEPVLIKQEKLEEGLCCRDPQPTPVEEQRLTHPTPGDDGKKPDTEPTPVGDPEELSEQHRCGHSDEELSGLEFVVKAEQEEEHSIDMEVRNELVLIKQEKLEEDLRYSDPQPTPVEEKQVTQPTPAGDGKKPDTEPTPVGDPEELSEQHRCGHGDEELSGLEFVWKAEQKEEHSPDVEVRTEPVLIKQEKLEEDLCYSDPQPTPVGDGKKPDPQPTPVEEEQVTQPTPVDDVKKPDTEPTPVGDPEELSEQHRCGHGDEELSGLEFVVKAEQEEEHSTGMEVRTEPVLIKQEKLEEVLCYSDPQPTPVEEEQVTQPTPVGDVKKPDTEPTPVGHPEELSEQHRCGHGDEELSGLEFVVKAEQEEEHVAQRLNQTGCEHSAGRLNNLGL
ncbi:hypothetical protein COCON_G00137240 [Conger conger]|uniref:Uncharacterized protein n=1 Tax=Conger conger TaxID=82655 RepID=A0A9Q1DEZ7_CONCO|nr:hypothetical protein COCON_G00137240 [Conger conger]